ncbi:MAG: signal peptidase I [Defluviitaleaceae bacterium]|nr:signal peptidase I [Defluviitaleaceae bacterium]
MRLVKNIFSWACCLLVAGLIAYILNTYIILNAQVITGSMESTIPTNGRVFGIRSMLSPSKNRGDIIVFDSPLPDFGKPFIKRIIGLPGETIKILGGQTYINGVALYEYYIYGISEDFGPLVVPERQFFVMGDNRGNSRDSREWGAICQSTVIGRIFMDFPWFR